jgi:transcriptional regulator with XRE-family HTH domain
VNHPKGVKAFGTHIRRLRDARNLSQQELADLSDLTKMTIQRIENGKTAASLDTQIALAKALELSLSQLMDYPLPKEKKK